MLVSIQKFGGISPRIPPRQLAQEQAQIALNCPLFYGTLQPLNDVGDAVFTLTKIGTPKTIYRFGLDILSDTQYWFSWDKDVDIVRTPIAGDTAERTYYTDGTFPKVTNNVLALTGGGTDYPINYYKLGIPAPTSKPIVDLTGTGSSSAIAEARVYAYSWVTAWGEESSLSPPSDIVNVKTEQTVNLTSFSEPPSGSYNVTKCRIYRATAGAYLFVDEITVAQTQVAPPAIVYADTKLAADLGESCPSIGWLPPPDDLKGLSLMPNGIMAGFTGRDVYMCDPYHPFAWPVANINTVDYPVVGLGVMNTTLCVLTVGQPYWIMGSDPSGMVVVKADVTQACSTKRSIVSMLGSVVYASPDGLVVMNTNGSKLITEELFTRKQWQALKPSSMYAYRYESQYVAFYDTGTEQGGFVFDFATGTFMMHDIFATAGYQDLVQDTLYLAFADRKIKKWFAGEPKNYVWKSKKFTNPYPRSFSCVKIQAESYPLIARFMSNNKVFFTKTVVSREPFRLPAIVGRDFELQVEGNVEIFDIAFASSMDEIGNG